MEEEVNWVYLEFFIVKELIIGVLRRKLLVKIVVFLEKFDSN